MVNEEIEIPEKASKEDYYRYKNVLNVVQSICNLFGFFIENRIVLKDTKTGYIWK